MRNKSSGGRFWWLLLAVTALSFVIAAAMLGPERSWCIARAAALSVTVDGLGEVPSDHRIPELLIVRDNTMADRAVLHDGPAEVPMLWYEAQGQGGLPDAVTTRGIALEKVTARLPVPLLWLDRGSIVDMVEQHMALWVAGAYGVATAWSTPAWVTIDHAPGRVMWLREIAGPDLLRLRNVVDAPVELYRLSHARSEVPWNDLAQWRHEGEGDPETQQRMLALMQVLNTADLPAMDRRDSLLRLVDVEAWLRYDAALAVMDVAPESFVLLRDPRHGRWLPVLDGVMGALRDSTGRRIADPVARMLVQEPDWRHRHQVLVREACGMLLATGAYDKALDELIESLGPTVLADRDKRDRVVAGDDNLYRVAMPHVASRLRTMRSAQHARGVELMKEDPHDTRP